MPSLALRRIRRYPLYMGYPEGEPVLAMFDGSHSMDEVCCARMLAEADIGQRLERCAVVHK